MAKKKQSSRNRYGEIIEHIFTRHHDGKCTEFVFDREEIEHAAKQLGIALPKNIGDVLYSFRFRSDLPVGIVRTAKKGREWVIELAGRSKYRFRQVKVNRV